MSVTLDQFRIRVLAYLRKNKIKPSTFGREVLNDPAWVSRLADGLEPKERTREKVLRAMK